ncbi:MAG TPA: bifunctional oligoribonuclease/PAP phosphatase NrnA [bacterium]|nr:bifunctional oligoribonuclease/PAP phosphatase NrnA [bacterium]
MPQSRKIKKNDLAGFCEALKSYDRFLLSCHVSPEGDAIGSILAMESLLRRLGKKTKVVAEDDFPTRLSCLSSKRWNKLSDFQSKPADFQALVVADCPTLERIGQVKNLVGPRTVIFNIDHHVSNSRFGRYNYVQPGAAASGEVVFDIFKKMRVPITREDATNLYVALSTDTGSFKYGNTTVRSHLIAAELIKTGIPLEKINDELYSTYSLNKINLYSRLLSRVKTSAEGRLAWATVRCEDLEKSGATYEDTEGFIDFLKFLKEVEIAFFLMELPQGGHVRISFRSRGRHDVNRIATHFKGGGHRKASGCILPGELKKVEKVVLEKILREFKLS